MENYNAANAAISEEERSYFDGGYFAYIGYNILVVFVTLITLGIAYPWMCCMLQRWKAKHTVVCGKRMYFDGTGLQLIGKYLLWGFLSVITFGIYGLWMSISMRKWFAKHTHYQGEEDNNSYFDGGVLGMIGTNLLAGLVLAVPVVGPAWSNIIKLRWETRHTVVDSRRHIFAGTVGNLFVKKLVWGLLTVITFGIYGWFVPVKALRWETENKIDNEHTTQALIDRGEYRANVHADATAFKTYQVEDDMECVKAGITDSMSEEALLELANSGVRAAQYTYVVRYADGKYTQPPYSVFLKAAAEAEYAPAINLYLQTHSVENNELLTKAADKGQLWALKAKMTGLAKEALALPENKNALPALKNAVRYADLLKENQETLTEEEQGLVKRCMFAIRRIQSRIPPSNSGKIVGIVIGVLVGVPVVIALIAGVIALFTKSVFNSPTPDFGGNSYSEVGGDMAGDAAAVSPEGNSGLVGFFAGLFGGGNETSSNMAGNMVSDFDQPDDATFADAPVQETGVSDFWVRFLAQMAEDHCDVTAVDTASDGTVKYELTCSYWYWNSLHYMEVLQTADGVERISFWGQRVYEPDSADPTMNQMQWESIIRVIFKELDLGGYEGIIPYTGNGEYTELHGSWIFSYSNTDTDVRVTIKKG